MPYKTDTHKLADQFLDKRVKMLDCQKEQAKRLYAGGAGIRELARLFKVDKRLIQFTLFPERHAKNLADRAARGGSEQYYDKDKHTAAIREHRRYKHTLLKDVVNQTKNDRAKSKEQNTSGNRGLAGENTERGRRNSNTTDKDKLAQA